MNADMLLSRLDGVTSTGRGRWIATCPAHDDGRPSLSVREADGGLLLIHCFASCTAIDVLAALGLEFNALFPDRPLDHRVRRERDPHHPRAVLFAVADEMQIAAIVSARVAYGYQVDLEELDRLLVAVVRVARAADLFRRHPSDGHRRHISRAELVEVADAS